MNKILVIGLSNNIGGVETFFHNYYRCLDQKKCHFDFATVTNGIAFEDDYKKDFCKIFQLPNFKKAPLKYYFALRRIIKNHHYDVVHINMLSAANVLPIFAARSSKHAKIVIHSHNADIPSGIVRKIMDKINRPLLGNEKYIRLACGQKAGEWLFGKKTNFTVIQNAIELKEYAFNSKNRNEIRKQYGIAQNEILLGNVGRFCEQKNQLFLIDALCELDSNYKLVLIGDGDRELDLKNKVKKYSLEDRVIFIKSTPDVNKYYSAFDIFVFPSLFEGTPVTLVEAQANGLNCVVSDSVTHEVDAGGSTYIPLVVGKWVDVIKKTKRSNEPHINAKYDISKQYQTLEQIYNTNKKVSIIIPVYNTEKYISKCLDSILSQTYGNLEIIIVNDGSTDKSENIIKKYVQKDQRIKYIKQKNLGANNARQSGLAKATGEYTMFVDSDDRLKNDAVRKLVDIFETSDCDIISFCMENDNGTPVDKKKPQTLSKEEIKNEIFSTNTFRNLCGNIYKTDILKQTEPFADGMSYGEDYYANLKILEQASSAKVIRDKLYIYNRHNNNSTTSATNETKLTKNMEEGFILSKMLLAKGSEWGIKPSVVALAICDIAMWAIYSAFQFDNNEAKAMIRQIEQKYKTLGLPKKTNAREFRQACLRRGLKYYVKHYYVLRIIFKGNLNDNLKKLSAYAKLRKGVIK